MCYILVNEYMRMYNWILNLSIILCVGGTSTPTEQKEERNRTTHSRESGKVLASLIADFFLKSLRFSL